MRNKLILAVALILAVIALAGSTGQLGRLERWIRRDATIDIVYTVRVSGEAIVRWVDGDVQLHQETISTTDAAPVTRQWRVRVPAQNNLSALSVTPQSADSWGQCRTTVDDPEGSHGADDHTVHGSQVSAVCTSMQAVGDAKAPDEPTARLLASATKDGAVVLTSTSSGTGSSEPLELGQSPSDAAEPDWPSQFEVPAYGRLAVVVISGAPDDTVGCSIEVAGEQVSDAHAAGVGELAVCSYQMP